MTGKYFMTGPTELVHSHGGRYATALGIDLASALVREGLRLRRAESLQLNRLQQHKEAS